MADGIFCMLESRSAKSAKETVLVPFATDWKTNVTKVPEPETPPAPGTRVSVTDASPVSLRMFLDSGSICLPSEVRRFPAVTSFSRMILGSKLILNGAVNRSLAFSTCMVTVMADPNWPSARAGEKLTATGVRPSCAGGAVAGGAVAAGVVTVGVVPGGAMGRPGIGGAGTGVAAAGAGVAAAGVGAVTALGR